MNHHLITPTPKPNRAHERRLREVYRSAGWPSLDAVEIELLAAGLLERCSHDGHATVRVSDAGLQYLNAAGERNKRAFTAHQALVQQVADMLLRDGRVVWTELSLRAWLAPLAEGEKGRWKMCRPDVFSIRNSSKQTWLEPIVHEIKVSRADLLGDLKSLDKRRAYLDIGGQVWYVLGCNAKGQPIAEPDEVPGVCGVLLSRDGKLEVLRAAPKRACADLPFGVWMALAKATPLSSSAVLAPGQQLL